MPFRSNPKNMALADIAQKILAEIDAQIKVLEKDFEVQKKTLADSYAEKEKAALKDLMGKTDKALKDVEQKILAMARQENKKALLQARRNILDQAMTAFLKAIESGDKKAIYEKLIAGLGAEKGTILAASSDEAVLKSLAKGFEFKADKNITGGFIVHAGGAEIDNTFHNLVYSVYRDELEMYFTDQLKLAS